MYKIDAHQHFWEYDKEAYSWIDDNMSSLKKDFLASDLEPLLKESNYDACVAVQARQSVAENDFLLGQCELSNFVKGVVGWVDLKSYDVGEDLEKYSNFQAMKGFRHIVQDEEDPKFLLGMEFIDGVKLLELYNYTYDLLIYEKQMPVAIKFLEKLSGNQKIVLDHIGKPMIKERLTNNWKDSIKVMAEYPALYVKISGLVTEAEWNKWDFDTFKPYLDCILEAFSSDRIMVGSDWPVCLLASDSYQSVLKIAEDYFKDFDLEEKRKIFGENCKNFYDL